MSRIAFRQGPFVTYVTAYRIHFNIKLLLSSDLGRNMLIVFEFLLSFECKQYFEGVLDIYRTIVGRQNIRTRFLSIKVLSIPYFFLFRSRHKIFPFIALRTGHAFESKRTFAGYRINHNLLVPMSVERQRILGIVSGSILQRNIYRHLGRRCKTIVGPANKGITGFRRCMLNFLRQRFDGIVRRIRSCWRITAI